MYILFNIKKEDINSIPKPNYIRVLGYSKNGKDYLSKLKKNVNIYTNIISYCYIILKNKKEG